METNSSSFIDKGVASLDLEKEENIDLGKQREEDKVQEAMESMDIQVIDEANLLDAKKPSAPRKKLITAIGLVLGCMISFAYMLVMYKREV